MSEEPQMSLTCPQCKTVEQVPSSCGGGEVKCNKCGTPIDFPINSGQRIGSTRRNNSEETSDRNNAADRISGWCHAFVIFGGLSCLILFIVGFSLIYHVVNENPGILLPDSLLPGILYLTAGVTIFIQGLFFAAILNWGAELLRCVGRIEDKMDK
ncbi:MAG: hypothetical protein WCJ56_10910 [bacterium]